MSSLQSADTKGVPGAGATGAGLGAAALLMSAISYGSALAATPDEARVVEEIYARTNALRTEAGLEAAAPQERLEAAARDFARHMARSGRYGHEADGRTPAERARMHDYDYCIVTENIAYQYSSKGFTATALAAAFADGWRRSPPHRKNIMDADVTETGAGVARSESDGRYYAVQMFGLPASRIAKFRITNRSPAAVQYVIEGRNFRLEPRATGTHSRCRPGTVTFQWPAGQEPARIQPSDGMRYVISRSDSGAWTVERER